MKEQRRASGLSRSPRTRSPGWSRPVAAGTLCLVLGSSLLGGCVVGAAVGTLSAMTTTGVLVAAVEDAVRFARQTVSLVVQNETEVYTGPGEEYTKIGRLNRDAEIQVLAEEGDWLRCTCGLFEEGWVHRSRVANL